MSRIEAIYHHGVFEPLVPVNLREAQRVQMSFESVRDQSPQTWLNQVQVMQAAIVEKHGILPDSAVDIALNRQR
jgi:predicted DNA-binding antitoxin AbrB/MazE fold protein